MDLAIEVRTALKAVNSLCVDSGRKYLSVYCFNNDNETRNTDLEVGDYYFRFEAGEGFLASYMPFGNGKTMDDWICDIDLNKWEIVDFEKPPVKKEKAQRIGRCSGEDLQAFD